MRLSLAELKLRDSFGSLDRTSDEISLQSLAIYFLLPARHNQGGHPVSDQAIAGYNVLSWSDGEFTYIAVSDLPSADLAAFQRAFAAASPAPEVK